MCVLTDLRRAPIFVSLPRCAAGFCIGQADVLPGGFPNNLAEWPSRQFPERCLRLASPSALPYACFGSALAYGARDGSTLKRKCRARPAPRTLESVIYNARAIASCGRIEGVRVASVRLRRHALCRTSRRGRAHPLIFETASLQAQVLSACNTIAGARSGCASLRAPNSAHGPIALSVLQRHRCS